MWAAAIWLPQEIRSEGRKMKTANEAAIKNIYDPNVEILAVLDTDENGSPSHILIRRLDEGALYEGTYTKKIYQVLALAIGVTKGAKLYADDKEGDWLIGFSIERRWLLTIAWHCFVEAICGWLRQVLRKGERK